MRIIRSIKKLRQFVKNAKRKGKTIGFVPTMGYLHEGHLSLLREAKKDCDICVVSIFVNPIQFGPKEDFSRYPRDIKRDKFLLKSAGADIIFYPSIKIMYPPGFLTFVVIERLSDVLCGNSRPGHFKGVTTVVTKLFNIVQADIAYFGQKDIQQSIIIQKMVEDLNMPLKIKLMPIVREIDGLAMSSRNVYLFPQQRSDAVILWQALKKAKQMINMGERSSQAIISSIKKLICTKKRVRIDYIDCVSIDNLTSLRKLKGRVIIALAVWIGKVRLIDNIIVRA
ncbi:MAG: pantoate--beta-alanine ligase [Candidatus Omnitrophota bacterium]|nr:pantoate--beta-alanine ligase [Candidatus Omnitrophota bacterium]